MMNKIDFQPMPKRFIVWDVKEKKFLDNPSEALAITPLGALVSRAGTIVCQSTNLFDKDGKEIFEGDIMQLGSHSAGVVQMVGGDWLCVRKNSESNLSVYRSEGRKRLGHILSDPELLEEGE